ncbi:MAG: rhomboid family intramembrane serine protease [Candidatus Nanohaloarchaea archaeon]
MNGEKSFHFVALLFTGFLGLVFFYQLITGFDPAFKAGVSPLWKFFASFLGHSDMEHFLNNAFFIGLFGSIYERLTSGRMFLATFLVSAVFANFTAFIFFTESFIIGASGGAMGVLAALALYRPNQVGLALGVPAPMWAVLSMYVLINLAGMTGNSQVAYQAHLFGMVSGAAIGYLLRDEPLIEPEEEEGETQWSKRIQRWEERWMLD